MLLRYPVFASSLISFFEVEPSTQANRTEKMTETRSSLLISEEIHVYTVYIHIYSFKYVYIHTYIYIHIFAYIYIHVYIYIFISVPASAEQDTSVGLLAINTLDAVATISRCHRVIGLTKSPPKIGFFCKETQQQ